MYMFETAFISDEFCLKHFVVVAAAEENVGLDIQ